MAIDVEARMRMYENRLDFLEIRINAMRGLVSAHLALLDRRFPGIARDAGNISLATMTRMGLERTGLAGALEALIEDIEELRDLPAND